MRKVLTASGAASAQITNDARGKFSPTQYLGTAHTPGDLAANVETGKAKLRGPGQGTFAFYAADRPQMPSAVAKSGRSGRLIDTVRTMNTRLGLNVIEDAASFQLVAAQLVESPSKSNSAGLLDELDVEAVRHSMFLNCLIQSKERAYPAQIVEKYFAHSVATTGAPTLVCRRRHSQRLFNYAKGPIRAGTFQVACSNGRVLLNSACIIVKSECTKASADCIL